jgi:hypothetical protein
VPGLVAFLTLIAYIVRAIARIRSMRYRDSGRSASVPRFRRISSTDRHTLRWQQALHAWMSGSVIATCPVITLSVRPTGHGQRHRGLCVPTDLTKNDLVANDTVHRSHRMTNRCSAVKRTTRGIPR